MAGTVPGILRVPKKDSGGHVGAFVPVIVGAHDFICGPAFHRPIAAGILGAEYHEIAGAGHLPQYEAPDEFIRIVSDWLERSP